MAALAEVGSSLLSGNTRSKEVSPANVVKKMASPSTRRRNIAKGTTDPRVEFISQVLAPVLVKFQFQDLDLALTSKSQPNISILKLRILTKASFRILT